MAAITVLMPVYNGMPYLPEAVHSILSQTFRDFVYLIINDGSTDGSEEYLNGLDDPRVRVVHRPHCGTGATLNVGLEMCQTEFLARMDADDLSLPGRLEAQLGFLGSRPEVGMAGTQFAYFGARGHSVLSRRVPRDHQTIYQDLLRGQMSFVHASLMCRSSILKGIGGYRIQGAGEDWDMFLRMGETTQLANIDECLYFWRIHLANARVSHLTQAYLGVDYARHCAKRRAENLPETTLDDFVRQRRARPFWQRTADAVDLYSLAQYRSALAEIANGRQGRGYSHLAWAALCSPRRTSRRLSRAFRKPRKSTLSLPTKHAPERIGK